jgi:flavorubredoxin
MGVTNSQSGTRVDEVADGIYRISTPLREVLGGFSFNQYLVRDDEPLLFHSGPRQLAPLTMEAIASVLPVESLRWLAFAHFEDDECGAVNELLARAPQAAPLCGRIGAMINGGFFARRPRAVADGEAVAIGRHRLRWLDTPHLPHGWDCGYLFDETARSLFCGDLFTQAGADNEPLTRADILAPSEAMRAGLDYFSHTRDVRTLMERLAATAPTTLLCMHGSAWQGDGAALLRALGGALEARPA